MNETQFEKLVSNRANQIVQGKIQAFRESVSRALCILTVRTDPWGFNPIYDEIISKPPTKWPDALWREAEKEVREDLFRIMDNVQRALIAPEPKTSDAQRAEPKENKGV